MPLKTEVKDDPWRLTNTDNKTPKKFITKLKRSPSACAMACYWWKDPKCTGILYNHSCDESNSNTNNGIDYRGC